ncbi:hypothetical protein AGRA3207_005031 [Actinomadura graeca]|uniref:Uncharacterized protein n=1 Tax=Actinomadura graeca TaxID=2750812 RepID=A0ABX8QYK5_9ACTN|nr:hypothetical protein [Actinomadura graeca]QXJ23822.1 hypothetical protein AGRA3207_005031 [Actinomadura graeca]
MSIPSHFAGLVDDAAVFPPGLAPLPDAVVAHAAHLRSDHRALVGPFIVSAQDLATLAELATPDLFPEGIRVSVVLPSPDELSGVLDLVRTGPLVLAGLEVKLGPGPLTPQVDVIAAHDRGTSPAYVEAPRPGHPEWTGVLDAAAASDLRLKFRTGGTEAAAFPDEDEVASWIHGAVRSAVPFKCTAGLHNAVRHTGADTGFEHHGYLNILLATAAAQDGASVHGLVPILGERDGRVLADRLAACPAAALRRARQGFLSYGSCSIDEPLADLAALGLITA